MKISNKQNKLILEPSKELSSLFVFLHKIAQSSFSEIEFLGKVKYKLEEFLQYGLHHIEELKEEIHINENEFDLLQIVGNKILENLKQFPKNIHCGALETKKNKRTYRFKYVYFLDYIKAYDGETYIFDIWSPENEDKRKFSFRLKKMKNGNDLKVVDLYPGSKENLGKGISIAIIIESKKIFNKRIISSSNDDKYTCHRGESNSPDAISKVWERMLKDGLVEYNEKRDYYYTV